MSYAIEFCFAHFSKSEIEIIKEGFAVIQSTPNKRKCEKNKKDHFHPEMIVKKNDVGIICDQNYTTYYIFLSLINHLDCYVFEWFFKATPIKES